MRTRRSVRPAHALAGVLLAAALAVTGCSGGGDSSAGSSAADDKAAAAPAEGRAADEGARQGAPGGAADGARATAPPKAAATHVIRTASLTVRVEDVPEALEEARAATGNAGGYVGDETTVRDGDGHEHTRVVLRVPVAEYEEVLAALEGTGKLLERNAKAEDVTDQVVDVESRITSQRASVARIRELMDRATRLSDVVTLEGELSSRQADLEALLAQQASLKDRTSLATITLELSERPRQEAAPKDDDPGFVDALTGGWEAFVTMLRWLAVAVGAVLPFAAAAALLVLLWLKAVRPRLPRRPRTVPAMPAAGPLPAARPAPEPGRGGTREGGEG
ncbi:DUF4349 domain-containing protein [Streptomyces capillispiralis]|uniref:Uncharacterized protein DUF4349 n=1 Tax=Streptomyces capillispiralis TaxID=68182 RepID=A0A561TBG4_9ACTN|nr:DUF4349 domain-containing protein [Streptomyces capillispiralis]TWF84439.1 uncharacterized protein DUF4349 [Streptomyces capillispiralis]GHH91983.1 lipoprotein [Streptomyces capillispiralis]